MNDKICQKLQMFTSDQIRSDQMIKGSYASNLTNLKLYRLLNCSRQKSCLFPLPDAQMPDVGEVLLRFSLFCVPPPPLYDQHKCTGTIYTIYTTINIAPHTNTAECMHMPTCRIQVNYLFCEGKVGG